MSRRGFVAGAAAGLAATALARMAAPPSSAKRIVLLAGRTSHGYGEHEHPAGCRLMADRLNLLDAVDVRVVVGWPTDPTTLADVDALIIYGDGGEQHPAVSRSEELRSLATRGVGLGFVHYALIIHGALPRQTTLDWIGGYYEPDWSVNPMWTARFDSLPEHPITRGVAPFALSDEWYYHMRFRPGLAGVTPLLTCLPPASSLDRPDGPHSGNPHVRRAVLEDKRPQHLAWCTERESGGRGFGFTGLHWHWNWAHDGFRTLLLNAVCWLAGVPIPPSGIRSERPTLEDLMQSAGPPPDGWDRREVEARIASWEQA